MIECIQDLVNTNTDLVRRGRFLSTTFLMEIGDKGYLVKILEGRIASITPGPFVTPNYSFALRAPRDEWETFWTELPPPGHHDIFALFKRGKLKIEGDLRPFMQNLLYIKDVLASPRKLPTTRAAVAKVTSTSPQLRAHRRPLSQLRTARQSRTGSISRRRAKAFRCSACTPPAPTGVSIAACSTTQRITDNFRVIVFDMPWHGKSSPPEGYQNEEYKLTSRDYIRMVLEISDALKLDKPVVMGCSIGGRIVLYLAHQHPERFRAIIGLETAAHVAPYYDVEWLHRPTCMAAKCRPASISGLVAPTAPDKDRWETLVALPA